MKDETNIIGEAPASATLSVVTPKGYNTLFTLREMSGEVLLTKIGALETKLENLGYKPQIKVMFGKKEKEYVEGKFCPLCKGRLIKSISKAGKEFHKCENGKWDAINKVSIGCKFIDWLNPMPVFDHKEPYKDGGMTKEQMEEFGA